MKKIYSICLIIIILAFLLIGCSDGTDSNQSNSNESEDVIKVALLVSGPINDGGWCAAAYEGLKQAEEDLGVQVSYTENVGVTDIEANYNDYASQSYDLIIGHGFQFGEPALNVAKNYPDTKFAIIEGNVKAQNVASYVLKYEEGGYLMGALSAQMTKTNKIGIVAGMEIPSVIKIVEAYKLGAKAVNPSIKVFEAYTGTFTDMSKGKEAAMAMINNGADVLSHAANQTGIGVIKAAQENSIYATGDSTDQNELAPNTVISSSIVDIPQLIYSAIKDVKEGSFKGDIVKLGMKEGLVKMAPYHGLESEIPDEVKEKMKELVQQIKSGEIKVPVIEEKTK